MCSELFNRITSVAEDSTETVNVGNTRGGEDGVGVTWIVVT